MQGAAVLAVGRDGAALAEVAKAVEGEGGTCSALTADVTEAGAPPRIVAGCARAVGWVDDPGECGRDYRERNIETTTDEEWDTMMDINSRAPFRLMRAAVPSLIQSNGSVVNVSSVTGLRSFPGVLAYCVSKSAIDQLTRCAALEVAAKGVRINAVNPGVVISNLHRRGGMNEEKYSAFLEHSKGHTPDRPPR